MEQGSDIELGKQASTTGGLEEDLHVTTSEDEVAERPTKSEPAIAEKTHNSCDSGHQ